MWRKLFNGEEEEEEELPIRKPYSELTVKKEEEEAEKETVKEESVIEESEHSETIMAKEENLVHKRGLVRAKVTRIRNSLKKMEDDQQQASLPLIRVFAKSLDMHYSEYNLVQDEILSVCAPAVRGVHEEKYEEFEELYNETSLMIERLKDALAPWPMQAVVPAGQQLQGAEPPQVIVQQQAFRAPLPTFDGKYENWPRFKTMFQDLMRRSTDCDAIKLYHLEKSLVGSAAGVVDSQTLQDNNYNQAWQILMDRYENERLIIDNHIRGLLNLKKMTKKSSKELRELVDDCSRHVENLKFMKQELLGVSELFVVNILTAALDKETREHWESSLTHGELPKYDDTIECLKQRCLVLERCETASSSAAEKPATSFKVGALPKSIARSSNAVTSQNEIICELCNGPHPNFKCTMFRNLTVAERIAKAREANICFNCLRKGHRCSNCQSERTCSKCSARHHTMLHPQEPSATSEQPTPADPSQANVNSTSVPAPIPTETTTSSNALVNHVSQSKAFPAVKEVLLLTARVNLLDDQGRSHSCRALLDCASQVCLISQAMVNKLGKKTWPTNTEVFGVTGRRATTQGMVVTVTSNYGKFSLNIPCLVMPHVSGTIPTRSIDTKLWRLPADVVLADPEFFVPSSVDLLIGNQFFFSLLKSGQLKIDDEHPLLQETVFGWVVSGPVDVSPNPIAFSHAVTTKELDELIQKFWAIEEVAEASPHTVEEQQIEAHFAATHHRDMSGRFVVQLPFRESVADLGNNRALALKRFYMLEKRLEGDIQLKQEYVKFITEYEALGHCQEVDERCDPVGQQCYYLPHHAVFKPSSSSTKLRVVFDATARSSKGASLNDVLQVGPTIQRDCFGILLGFRMHRIAISGDLSKMYRQIRVDPRDTRFQRIFWRNNPTDSIRVLELATVTYGTASAPFLATRSLVQLAEDEQSDFPEAAEVVRSDFYIDDALTGADTEAEAIHLREDLQKLLARGGFDIRKWCSNSAAVLEGIPEEEREKLVKIDNSNDAVKTLGMLWDPFNDEFRFSADIFDEDTTKPITKQFVLSQISKLFDPIGFVAPVIVLFKILMQSTWERKLAWTEPLPDDMRKQWLHLRDSLNGLDSIKIPRCVIPVNVAWFEIHGFADASKSAYGACLYLRSVKTDSSIDCQLLCSKSRVAPLSEMTIPKLELCAALLLSRLVLKVIPSLKVPIRRIVLYSDSQIVLSWMKKSPGQLQIFVRNRIVEINQTTADFTWEYVRSEDNPADIVSRGLFPLALSGNQLWWKGCRDLLQSDHQPATFEDIPDEELPEMRTVAVVNLATIEILPVFSTYSSFRKLQRVVAYVLRFIRNCRSKKLQDRQRSQQLTVPEMQASLERIVLVIQRMEFPDEIQRVLSGEPSKRLAPLCPIVENGILRVGGRLQNSTLPFDARHQMILPNHHPITERIIRTLHEENRHVGPAGLLAIVRQKFWILNGRSTVRKVTRSCIPCYRTQPRKIHQLMGNLPDFRVTPAMAFEYSGVDYAGPVMVKEGRYRPKIIKGYIAVFVCLVTKNVHLELVSSLTTEAFLAALDRFVSRRGLAKMILSDNATNFSGASNELHELYRQFQNEVTHNRINDFLLPREIEWRFIPPRAPNFAGLMEAAVKSVKTHLKRTLQNATLTFEEFATVLCHIESILNSRPLYAMSSDPNDPMPITPAHLQLGRVTEPVPKPSYLDSKENRLSRWQYLNLLRDRFWQSWSKEYLSTLQARGKWTKTAPNIVPGMVVLIIEDNVPPQCWKYGKIVKTYPGSDSLVRVADVKSATGIFKRSISKLAPLPTKDNENLQRDSEIPSASSDVPDYLVA